MDTEIQRYLIDLDSKNNIIRKQAFDELIKLTDCKVGWADEAFDILASKLNSSNSYQRSIGTILLSNLAKSGIESKLAEVIESYLARLDDEKFITARQSIQACFKAAVCCGSLRKQIVYRLFSLFSSSSHLISHANLIQKDIVVSLYNIYKECPHSVDAEELKTCIASTGDKKLMDTLIVSI